MRGTLKLLKWISGEFIPVMACVFDLTMPPIIFYSAAKHELNKIQRDRERLSEELRYII